MDSVFILWHNHEVDDSTDTKLIGVYRTAEDAEAARTRVACKPGFKDTLEGFEIIEYLLGTDQWTEGYISESEAMRPPG